MKKLSFTWLLYWKTSHWYWSHPFYLSVSPFLWQKCQKVLSSCYISAHAMHAGRFDCLMSSLILMTMSNGRVHWGSPECKDPKPNPQRNWKLENVYCKLCRIPWHCTQSLGRFVRYTWPLATDLSPGSLQIRLGLGYHVPVFCTVLNYIALFWYDSR